MFISAKELLPGKKEIFDDNPETMSFFQTKLEEKLNKLPEKDILILDFWKLDIPRLRTFDKGFRTIYEKGILPPIVLVNVKDAEQLQESVMEGVLLNVNTVMPIVSRLGDIFWIGIKDKRLKNICNLLFEDVDIKETDINSSIKSFLKKNSWLYSFKKRELFKRMSEEFEKYLKDKLFRELAIKKEGHYLLPSGGHCKIALNTSGILTDPKLIENIAFEVCRRVKDIKIDVILCHSLFATCVGKEIAKILGADYYTALGYPFPRCHFESKISKRRVLILSTLIRSGTTIRNLQDYVKQKGGKIGKVIALLDTRELSMQEIGTEAIISYPIKYVTKEECSLCREGKPLESIDYFTGVPLSTRKEEHLPSLLRDEEFWEMVIECDALREGHLQVNGHHFSLFIETHKIFKNEEYLTNLSNTLLEHFSLLFDTIVHPLNESAILFAAKLADLTNAKKEREENKTVVIPACKHIETNDFIIPEIYREKIENKNVLIVDDGANFGNTTMGMHFAVKEYNPKTIKYAVFVNRLGKTYRKILDKVLHEEGHNGGLVSLFYLYASPVYRPWECPMCNELQGLETQNNLRTTLSREAKGKISIEISKLKPITISDM